MLGDLPGLPGPEVPREDETHLSDLDAHMRPSLATADPAHARCALQYDELERTLATVLAERPAAPAAP